MENVEESEVVYPQLSGFATEGGEVGLEDST